MRRALGFSKTYNFVLFVLLVGPLMAFTVALFRYVDVDGYFCVTADEFGECYYDFMRLALKIHLITVMPASFLVCFQFVPIIRRKFPSFHRANGYLIFALSVAASVGGVMSGRHAFGGEVGTHVLAGVLFLSFMGSTVMGMVKIRRRRVEEHRVWMLRAWVYASSIITMRLLTFTIAGIISSLPGSFYSARQCGQIDYLMGRNATLAELPGCQAFYLGETEKYVLVRADLNGSMATAIAAFGISFAPAGFLAFIIHAFGIEAYLSLTTLNETGRSRGVLSKK
ncbi:hypothetical protein OQA88_5389 [Cercophora sp. LCS_1]